MCGRHGGVHHLSFLVEISPDPALLVVLRGVQGISAALMSPAALSIVLATFGESNGANQALGYWSMVASGGGAVGLLLGGVLTTYAAGGGTSSRQCRSAW